MIIRPERPEDYSAILRLTYEAFLSLDYPGRRRADEHYLIYLLQGSDLVIPGLCFVAEWDGEIIGYILYTKSEILHPDGSKTDTITFGPLSVAPKYHRQGIGAALVRHSMEKARELGYGAVLITGVPEYYPKLGFKRARDCRLTLSDGTSPDAFMVYELKTGYLSGNGVLRFLPPEFEQSEEDDAGYGAFHKQFMAEYYPGRLILGPLYDNDIPLMERWLHAGHVAPWYERPEDWLCEIRGRRGEFSFISHMIAEFNGCAIGFCQYYDCSDAKEEWYIAAVSGETYSIDYMVGEPEYLRRGFGKQMISQLLKKLWEIGAKTVIVQPDKENVASNRSLETNGFVWNGNYYEKSITQEGMNMI